ncbi:hypothetical protein KUCAC02_016490, partial [Chaenocephalus aceratus]
MLAGVSKQRCALQNGFFDQSFKRIFEREALSDPVRLARQNRNQQNNKNLGKAFLPCNRVTQPCGSGSYYGTLSGPLEAMSPLSVTQKAHRSPGRNIVTSPSKKGSGYSYPNVTLSRIELYASDPYSRTREVLKKEAAIHHSKLKMAPSYSTSIQEIISKATHTAEPVFYPAPGPKSVPVKSIISVNVN